MPFQKKYDFQYDNKIKLITYTSLCKIKLFEGIGVLKI